MNGRKARTAREGILPKGFVLKSSGDFSGNAMCTCTHLRNAEPGCLHHLLQRAGVRRGVCRFAVPAAPHMREATFSQFTRLSRKFVR